MPEISQEWIDGLNAKELEMVVALGIYHRRAMLLFIHTNEWFQAHFTEGRTDRSRREIFDEFFIPYYLMWASLVYVVHEGFVELDIQDAALQTACARVDINLLRRFRNATFHYQPRYLSPKHDELIRKKGFKPVRTLFDRQGVLVRKMGRMLKKSANSPVRGARGFYIRRTLPE